MGHYPEYSIDTKEVGIMKGYSVSEGYMGFVDGVYMLFASENDYWDYVS